MLKLRTGLYLSLAALGLLILVPAALAGTGASTTTIALSTTTFTYGMGASETFTVTITGTAGNGAPTGTVAITGNGGLGTLATITIPTGCTPNNGHKYTCTATGTIPQTTFVGTYTITATYSGNTAYATSTGTATVSVTKQTPTVGTVTATPSSVAYGSTADVTFSVPVSWTGPVAAPAQPINFAVDGGTALVSTCTGATSPETCSYTTYDPAALAGGAHTVSATLANATEFNGATGTSGTLTVDTATPTAKLTAATAAYGGSITLTATNKGVTGGTAPTGLPTFTVGGTTVPGTPSCTTAGRTDTCTLAYTLPPALTGSASYTSTVTFAASTDYSSSTDSSTVTVTQATPTAAVADATQRYAKNIELTETNTGIGATYDAPTGIPVVTVGAYTQNRGKTCTSATDVETCEAEYSIRDSQTLGNYTITATFAADDNYVSSTATGTLTVDLDLSATAVTATPSNPTASGTFVLDATVSNSSHAATTPTGTVTFTTPSATLGNCTLASATCSITASASSLTHGAANVVTASYGGLALEIKSSSGTVTVTPGADIVFTSVSHNFGTVPVGSTATYGVQLTNEDSVAFPFTLSLTGASDFTSATNCPTSVLAGNSCEIVFTYTPTASAVETATWSLTAGSFTFAPGNGGTLTATGTTASGVTLTTNGHDFGYQAVGTVSDLFGAVLTNGTASSIVLTFAAQTDTADFITFANNCPATLAAYQTCNLQYEFAPQSLGFLSDTVGISATQGGSPVTITANGVAATGILLDGDGD
jgi:hypothetical protein